MQITSTDTTPYVVEDVVRKAVHSLKTTSDNLLCWFAINQMKANPDKCHLLASCDNEMSICVNN